MGMWWKMLAMVGMLFDWGADNEWGPNKPKFCNDLDCPPYKVVNKTEMFEVRCYPELQWVSTEGLEDAPSWNKKSPFMRLFKYISGENSEKKKIAMTAPVTMKHTMKKVTKGDTFTMSFYLPLSNPPEPTDPKTKLTKSPKTCFYVHSYGGYSNDRRESVIVKKLKMALKKMGYDYDSTTMWTAGYDSPMKFWNRHNEIWLKA